MSNHVQVLAGLITEDPNHSADRDRILFEFFWGGLEKSFTDPLEKALAPLLDKNHIKQFASARQVPWDAAVRESMDGLKQEFQSFQRNYKIVDARQALRAFTQWKQTGNMPRGFGDRDPRELDARGGEYSSGGKY